MTAHLHAAAFSLALAIVACAGPQPAVPAGDLAFAAAAEEARASEQFMLQAAAEPGAVLLPSGVVITEITPGKGAHPKLSDTITVRYKTRVRGLASLGEPASQATAEILPLSYVIPCWREALPRMQVGGASRLACPASLAYGERGAIPVVPPNAALVFDVELLAIGESAPRPGH